jgi:lipopolysaccharide export LptBFGC system permease protein LptF
MAWDLYLCRRYVFLLVWISTAVYSIYFCSDLLFKLDQFDMEVGRITRYYTLRVVPFFVITMPTLAFVTQLLLVLSLHQRKEWHIAKMLCVSNFRLCRGFIGLGVLLVLAWLGAREILLPQLAQSLNHSEASIREETPPLQVLSLRHSLAIIQSQNSKYTKIYLERLPLGADRKSAVWTSQKLSYDGTQWTMAERNGIPDSEQQALNLELPSPQGFFHRDSQYTYASFGELLAERRKFPLDALLNYCCWERVLFPLAFLYFFSGSALSILRCREMSKVWILPALYYVTFSVFCMTLKTTGLRFGPELLAMYLVALGLMVPWSYARFFRRRPAKT